MMSEQRKWGVQDCPNGFYYLADSIDGLYIGTGGYILDDDEDGILAICELLNEKESIITVLKEENKKLKNQNTQLREINKEIGDDLYDCRLNKNITSKVLKLWQDTLAEYGIYTINDFRESFELDAKINKEKEKNWKSRS